MGTVRGFNLTQKPAFQIKFVLAACCGSLLFFAACSAQSLRDTSSEIYQNLLSPTPEVAPMPYKTGVQQLKEKKYDEALTTFQNFLSKTGSTRWSQAAVINSGRALEGLSRWSEALEKYNGAIQFTQTRAPRLQTYALYRASYCYEALGEDQITIATLLDLLIPARTKFLNREMTEAEIPGRLAAAYARAGALNEANAFYERAEAAVLRMKASSHGHYPAWLGETLYLMGKVPTELVSWESAARVLRELERTQKFALEAASLNQEPWSHEANQSLIGSYRDLFTVLQSPPYPKWDDEVLAQRDAQRSQWNLASEMLDRLRRLKSMQLPVTDEDSSDANDIFEFADDLSRKLQLVLLQQPAGDGLTAASAARIEGSASTEMPRTIEPSGTFNSEKPVKKLSRNTTDTAADSVSDSGAKMVKPKTSLVDVPANQPFNHPVSVPANKSVPKDDPNL